ncbi:dihydropteroate synthase [Ktedonospora formicarum]|uniref:dihydropteroate synthase n=1 Tax=Ktedonospora formicarum TaxID=2778364 RepID=A0A8J3MQW6_9CHLR|nr:dihydropteroate synthase [Ktedonospora formicarum]GHO43048.1 hypothetical protein KSX_12110 [Ktedonospora formicarum]
MWMEFSLSLPPMTWGRHRLDWGRQTYVMGIVNVTPDSFSGDGISPADVSREDVVKRAVEQARSFVAQGARFIDVGGESTRPGFPEVSARDEAERVVPVIEALHAELPADVIISVDTSKAEVAEKALAAGADMLNDIWGLQKDSLVASVARAYGVPVILMANMRGFERRELISDITRFLAHSLDMALKAGIPWEHLIIDPGIGFGMGLEGDLLMLHRLGELRALGRPILLGTSRKSVIGKVLGGLPVEERVEGTAATVALGIAQGADIVRVHDVREMMRVVKMSDAVVRGTFALD